jgi:hypothetical protein
MRKEEGNISIKGEKKRERSICEIIFFVVFQRGIRFNIV